MSTNFGSLPVPGAYSVIDPSGLTSQGQVSNGFLGIVGLAAAGVEDTVYEFNSSKDARDTLQGGEMLSCLRAFFASNGRKAFVVRCGAPAAAAKNFAKASNLDAVTLTALNKGTNGNTIEAKWTNGSDSSHRILTVRHVDDYNNVLEVFDNGGGGYTTVAAIKAAVLANSQLVVMTDDGTTDLPDVGSFVLLVGGTDGTRSTNEVSDALTLLLGYDSDIIILDTSDSTYHAIALAHCVEASNIVNRHERTCVLGMNTGTTVAAYIAAAQALANKRAVLAAPCLKTPDFDTLEASSSLKNGHLTAACMAGLKAGQPDAAEPITEKDIQFAVGLEKNYTETEVEQLLLGGVAVIALRRGGNKVIQQKTTDAGGDFDEWSVVTSIDYVMRDMRDVLWRNFGGRKGVRGTRDAMAAMVKSRLSLHTRERIIFGFVESSCIADFMPNNMKWLNVGFTAVPIFPINTIAITGTFTTVFNVASLLEVA